MSMSSREEVVLTRDVEATVVPYGDKVTLTAGSVVYITQALGGAYTVVTMHGWMCRVDGPDGDALGKEAVKPPSPDELANRPLTDLVWDQLRTCYDPEIPVNIVELGLVQSVGVAQREEGGGKVEVRFNLTAPGCGMGDVLRVDIERKVLTLPGVAEADVQIQLDPPWDQSRMSDAARLQLGLM